MTKPGTYGTVVLPGMGGHAPGMKTANGYVIIKGGEAVIKLHGDVVDFFPVAVPHFTVFDADYEILWDVTAEAIAQAIWVDEQKCQTAILDDPTSVHLNGRLAGLQRARDIAHQHGGKP